MVLHQAIVDIAENDDESEANYEETIREAMENSDVDEYYDKEWGEVNDEDEELEAESEWEILQSSMYESS